MKLVYAKKLIEMLQLLCCPAASSTTEQRLQYL